MCSNTVEYIVIRIDTKNASINKNREETKIKLYPTHFADFDLFERAFNILPVWIIGIIFEVNLVVAIHAPNCIMILTR